MPPSSLSVLLQALVNKELPQLMPSYEPEDTRPEALAEAHQQYEQYMGVYAPALNTARDSVMEVVFSARDEAVCFLNAVIRSFVPGFCLHSKGKQNRASNVWSYHCHSVEHSRRDEARRREPCHWGCRLQHTDRGWRFRRIDAFERHGVQCLRKVARMTKSEVDFACAFAAGDRQQLMQGLKRPLVSNATCSSRKCRRKGVVQQKLRQLFGEELIDRGPLLSEDEQLLSNYAAVGALPRGQDQETVLLHRLLAALKRCDGADAFAEYDSGPCAGVRLRCVHVLWPLQKRLLARHADAVLCRTLWQGLNGDHALYVQCVVDGRGREQTVAACATAADSQDTWQRFFAWVKALVPQFDPRCVVTDGSTAVIRAFRQALPSSRAQQAVCSWGLHRSKSFRGLETSLGGLVYSALGPDDPVPDADTDHSDLSRALVRRVLKLPKRSDPAQQMQDVQDLAAQNVAALRKLRCFVGGGVSINYEDAIDDLAEEMQLHPKRCIYEKLCLLRAIAKKQEADAVETPLLPEEREALMKLLEPQCLEQVGPSILRSVLETQKLAASTCHLFLREPPLFCVVESREIQCKSRPDEGRECCVRWDSTLVLCSCGRDVGDGVPCVHIVTVAATTSRAIPLVCFNSRFLVSSQEQEAFPVAPGAEASVEETATAAEATQTTEPTRNAQDEEYFAQVLRQIPFGSLTQ